MSVSVCRLFLRLFLLSLLAAMSTRALADALPDAIAQLLHKHRIPAAAVSLMVRAMDPPAAKPALSVNATTPRNPASVMKLLTTLSALELLGPGHQWHTRYLAADAITGGVLRGDLVLRGGGDPFITVERLLGDLLALRQHGIDTIAGDLVIDNSRFAPPPHDRAAFDGKPQRLYNVGPDAALINLSATRFVIEPHDAENAIRVRAEPPLDGLEIANRITARAGKCISRSAGWRYRIDYSGKHPVARFRGVYRPRCGTHSISRSLLANTDYACRLFAALWRNLRGELGGCRVGVTPDGARQLLARSSAPLADLITGINKFSNNVMARQLLLTLGAELRGEPGTLEGGIAVIEEWLTGNRIAMPALALQNGAGLSRAGRASAAGLSALLARGWRGTYRPEFLSSLPLAAIDGTMRTRLLESPLRGRARIKTGLIDGVRSMAGYVHARDGRHYSVVMMIDSGTVNFWNGNLMQDAVLRWVYERDG